MSMTIRAAPGLQLTARLGRLYARALADHQAGRLALAADGYAQVLRSDPGHVEALHRQALAFDALDQRERALACFDRLVALAPDRFEGHHDRGVFLVKLGQPSEAVASIQRALALAPDYAESWFGLGNAHIAAGDLAAAVEALDRAVQVDPGHARAWVNLASALNRLGRRTESLRASRRAVPLAPAGSPMQLRSLGDLVYRIDPSAAVEYYTTALAAEPGDSDLKVSLSFALARLGRHGETLEMTRQAASERPGQWLYEHNLAFALLTMGHYAEGWAAYESRLRDPANEIVRHMPGTLMRGGPTPGDMDLRGRRVLVQAEQGMGDIIQFARYLPMLRAAGAHVTVRVPDALAGLVAPLADVTVTYAQPIPDCELSCLLLSLPALFRTTRATIPGAVPYLRVPPARRAAWIERLGRRSGLRVGVIWAGNPEHANDDERSIPAAAFLRCVDVPGIELHALHRDLRESDRAAAAGLRAHAEALSDFTDAAALVSAMDLVIAVDTAVAHLAGALGRPVWLLVSAAVDFRWLAEGQGSPWYPTMRLFRQARYPSWDDVLERVRHELAQLAAAATT